MANIFDVAKYILDVIGGEISTLRLQKLCYYSQAWTLVWDGKPLFNENFIKWDNGPVCHELFKMHQGLFYAKSTVIPQKNLSTDGLSVKDKNYINRVIEFYGRYSGAELSEMTHAESPWKDAGKNKTISKKSIKDYYFSLGA